ncbi:MAG: hypothetical protein O7G85_10490 [Planctomycetota bacterium]|nr:hypothetical protein [Planctomycetota bacterium]
MKLILTLVLTSFASIMANQETPSDTIDAFRFDASKVEVGKAYFYLKSNIDGTRPSNVAHYLPDDHWIESLKWNDDYPGATLVLAKMDWETFSVGRFETYSIDEQGVRSPRVVMTEDFENRRVQIEIGDQKMTTAIDHYPWHSYDFDYASLVHTLPHLIDPRSSVVVGRVDLVREPEPTFTFIGNVEVTYVAEEERGGTMCIKYHVDGEGLEHRGGDLWIDKAKGHLVDYEIDLPDEPGFKDGKMKLVRIETMTKDEWAQFTKTMGK